MENSKENDFYCLSYTLIKKISNIVDSEDYINLMRSTEFDEVNVYTKSLCLDHLIEKYEDKTDICQMLDDYLIEKSISELTTEFIDSIEIGKEKKLNKYHSVYRYLNEDVFLFTCIRTEREIYDINRTSSRDEFCLTEI